MKYMLLIYLDEARYLEMPQSKQDRFVNAMLDHDDRLRDSGHYVTSDALLAPSEAATVRVRQGKLAVTDGPFMETKEHLSGFYIIEARDLNEAIRLAADIPLATVGSVEVRPVDKLERIEE